MERNRRIIEQKYVHYKKWECYKLGMYNNTLSDSEILEAKEFMENTMLFSEFMGKVINTWVYSTLNFLTNKSINRNAYLGQSSVLLALGFNNRITKQAWALLSENKQGLANLEASKHIKKWELEYILKLKNTLNSGKKGVTNKAYQMKLNLV